MNTRKSLVPWIAYLIFFSVLNETVFGVTTPAIARQFALSPSGVSWMVTVFMVSFGVGSVIFGRLSDLMSLRTLLVAGVGTYCVGSVAGFLVQAAYPLVLTARAVQGFGASAVPALAFVIIVRNIPEAERGKVFGLTTSTVSLGIGLGPVIGGFVTASLSWSYLFLVPLFMVLSIPALMKRLPRESRRQGGVDLFGALLTALTVGFLVIFLSDNRWYYLLGMAGALAALYARMRSVADPFIRPSLFMNAGFRSGVLSAVCLFSVVIGTFFLVPLMVSSVYHLSASQIGLILFPGAISSVVVGPLAGKLSDRKGSGFAASVGLGLLVGGMLLMSFLGGVSPVLVALPLLFVYAGFSFLQTAMINGVSLSLAPAETGIGMGVFNLVGVISGAVGAAVAGRLLGAPWMRFSLFHTAVAGSEDTNLLAFFAVVITAGGLLYLRAIRIRSIKA